MLYDVFGKSKKEEALKETWGHLAPKYYKQYKGFIIYCINCFGCIDIIDFDFKDLCSSLWLYDHLYNFVNNNIPYGQQGPKIYKFEGTYKCFKNNRYEFKGNTIEVKIQNA